MQYVEPKVTNTLKADTAIQGLAKIGGPLDNPEEQPSSTVGYRADAPSLLMIADELSSLHDSRTDGR